MNKTGADIWQALADPTRRQLIDRLAIAPRSTSDLCDGLPMSRFGVMKHLAVLERSGLITTRKQGRQRLNYLNVAPFAALHRGWLSQRAGRWAEGIHRFAQIWEDDMNTQTQPGSTATVQVALDWTIPASQQAVWRRLVDDAQSWWPAEHRAGPEGCTLKFDAVIGGQLREERADGAGLLWYSVIAIDPMRSIDMVGHLASRYGGPATSLLHLELAPALADGTTVLRLTDAVFGRVGPGLAASLTEGWQAIVGEGLAGSFA